MQEIVRHQNRTIEQLNESVCFEDRHENHEIFAAYIVLADVKVSNAVCALESEGQVLKTKTIVEEPVKVAFLDSVLILELHF